MTKFNLKEHIAKNKATFFGSLTEGQFSWMTQDTGQQIGSQDENKISVYMFDNKGKYWFERDYDGYGVFGGMDYYELLDQMNGGKGDRGRGIDLAFDKSKEGETLFPALVVSPSNFNYKTHDFTKEAEHDPNQSWYEPEEDDFYDQNDEEEYGYNDEEEELEEGEAAYEYEKGKEAGEKIEKKKMKVSEFKAKIREMVLAEANAPINMVTTMDGKTVVGTHQYGVGFKSNEAGQKMGFKDNPTSIPNGTKMSKNESLDEMEIDVQDSAKENSLYDPLAESDFLAELEGMLNKDEDLTPLQQYVYDYEIEISGEDQLKKFLDDIKQLKTPDDVYDYYADKRGWKGSMDNDLKNIYKQVKRKFSNLSSDDLTPLQRRAYSYTKERFGDEEAKNSLDQIKTLKTGQEFTNWVNQKLKSLSEAKDKEVEDDKHIVMKGNKFYTGTEFVDDKEDAMKYNLKTATEVAKREKGMVYTPKAVKEAKKDEEVEDEVDIDIESPEPMDTPTGGINVTQNADADLTGTEKEVQDNLEAAMEAAKKLGDEKLSSQIGNTLTFFTRQHVVKENLKETLLLQKRAGIITETQYKQKLNEISEDEDEVPLTSKVKSFINKAIADSKKDGEFEELKKADWFENELIDELISLFPNKDYDSASSKVTDYIKDKIK
jgi:hypothetical protein